MSLLIFFNFNSNAKEMLKEFTNKVMIQNPEGNFGFSCRTKKTDDLDLSLVVPSLFSVAFKGKMF